MADFMFEEDVPDHRKSMENRHRGLSEHYERRYCHKNGQTVWTLVSAVPIMDAEQNFQGSFGMFTDITERKRAEETLENERKRMDVILSALNTGLSLINPDMTIAWVNQKIREMFPGREPLGQICHLFYESRATICDGCGTVRTFMDGKVCESEQMVPGTGRWYYIISQPIRDTTGCVVNVLEGITDITERKRAEEKILALNEELEQRVKELTKELERRNHELEQMNKVFVGRELKMVELKKRIKELEGER
jgi:PAS domain-containing protein